jgi:hypothetical protein
MWDITVESALAYGDSSEMTPIRVPGFLLQGERILPTRTLRPAEYAQRWRDHDLDAYLECWAGLRGERRCLNCFSALPGEADERKRFCNEKCRNAAKQRRHRERNPDSVERAQQRYWQSRNVAHRPQVDQRLIRRRLIPLVQHSSRACPNPSQVVSERSPFARVLFVFSRAPAPPGSRRISERLWKNGTSREPERLAVGKFKAGCSRDNGFEPAAVSAV